MGDSLLAILEYVWQISDNSTQKAQIAMIEEFMMCVYMYVYTNMCVHACESNRATSI